MHRDWGRRSQCKRALCRDVATLPTVDGLGSVPDCVPRPISGQPTRGTQEWSSGRSRFKSPPHDEGQQAEVLWYGATVDDKYAYGLRLLDDVSTADTWLGRQAVLWLPDGATSVIGTVAAAGNDYDDDLVTSAACWLVVTEDQVRTDANPD